MALDPEQDKVQYQWMHAKAALGKPEDAVTRYRDWGAGSPADVRELRFPSSACLMTRDYGGQRGHRHRVRAGARRPEADRRPG